MNWFERFFVKRLFNYVAKKLDGHKTKLGGAAMLLSGLALLLTGLSEGGYDKTIVGLGLAGKGLEAIGLAGKFEKLTKDTSLTDEEKRRLLQ